MWVERPRGLLLAQRRFNLLLHLTELERLARELG
jgi:hypothetical protein